MQTIFIMVKCELGKAYAVADEAVQSIEQVSEVYSTSGEYDLLIKCYLPDETDIGHFVTDSMQRLSGSRTPSRSSPSRPLPEGFGSPLPGR